MNIFPCSCLALNDLIRGRQADDLIDYLSEMWETLFRVLDDIKVKKKLSEINPFFSPLCTKVETKPDLWSETHLILVWHYVFLFVLFQESVRKAADLTLKTLSKVRLFVPTLTCRHVYICVYLCPITFVFLCRCVFVCVSLQELLPRELWRWCCLPC